MYSLLFVWKSLSIFRLLLGNGPVPSCCKGLYAAQRFIIGESKAIFWVISRNPQHLVGTASPWPSQS
ncbi:hypothetical protein IMY05_002G0092500 [Salix suchowensis]|nr:hypothetical protein IMY05_002G0092500 [Salix suchowensis]